MEVHIITDIHDREKVVKTLNDNGFGFIPECNIHISDYTKYGEMCKAVIMKEYGINMLIDDFPGYLTWDSKFGEAPIRLQIMPDATKPYWHDTWITDPEDGDFGRRKYSEVAKKKYSGEVMKRNCDLAKEKIKEILKDSEDVRGIGFTSIDEGKLEIIVNVGNDFFDFDKIPSELFGVKINHKTVGKIKKL